MTHNLTHTAKCAKRFRKHSAGRPDFLPCIFGAAGLPLHDLRHEAAHCFCRLILHPPSGVGVGAEGATPIWSGGKSMVQQRDEEILTMLIAEICGGMIIVIAPL